MAEVWLGESTCVFPFERCQVNLRSRERGGVKRRRNSQSHVRSLRNRGLIAARALTYIQPPREQLTDAIKTSKLIRYE